MMRVNMIAGKAIKKKVVTNCNVLARPAFSLFNKASFICVSGTCTYESTTGTLAKTPINNPTPHKHNKIAN